MVDERDGLRACGFDRVGAIRPILSGRSCETLIVSDILGEALFAFVVDGRVAFIGSTARGLGRRVRGAAGALKAQLENPERPTKDPFQREAPDVIRNGQEIEVWGKASTPNALLVERDELNVRFTPLWLGRLPSRPPR